MTKRESFARGAFVLSLAAFFNRAIGVFYKPIIVRIFSLYDGSDGSLGNALTVAPTRWYQVILSFTAIGVNVAIARLVAEQLALGRPRTAKRVFTTGLKAIGLLGLTGGLLLFTFAGPLATLTGLPEASWGFRATALTLVIASVGSAFRGLFQGLQQQVTQGKSQIVEQLFRASSGITLVYLLAGVSLPAGAAGFNLGDGVGALASLIYLLWMYKRAQPFAGVSLEASNLEPPLATRPLLRRLLATALPICFLGAASPLMMLLESSMIVPRLISTGVDGTLAQSYLSALDNSFNLINIPAVISTALYSALIPALASAWATGDRQTARATTRRSLGFIWILGLPATAGLWFLGEEIYALIYKGTAHGLMQTTSLATLFLMLQQVSSGILQGIGEITPAVRNMLLGLILKGIMTYVLLGLPGVGPVGATWATTIGFAVGAILNLFAVAKCLGPTLSIKKHLLLPLAATALMVGALVGLKALILPLWPRPNLLALPLAAVGAAIYGSALLAFGTFSRAELAGFPLIGRFFRK